MNMMTRNEMLAAATVSDPRWAAVAARDPSADGSSSTRSGPPACTAGRRAARGARGPRTWRFHATAADAERAGFRPCKRCKPDQPSLAEQHAATVAELCRLIESAEQPPTLDAAGAARAGLSAYHLHRVFKAVTGLTPRAYAAAHRGAAGAQRARAQRTRSPRRSTTPATTRAAASTANRTQVLGMTPTDYRAGGADTRDPLRRRRVLARLDPGRAERARRVRDPRSATIPTRWRAISRTASRAPR